jgi:hypothetical protein
MRAVTLGLILLTSAASAQAPGGVVNDQRPCEFMGHRLMGKVRFVDSFPDFNVKVMDDEKRAELRVRRLSADTPQVCGEWQIVDGLADFTVRIVDSGEDFRIVYVKDDPGIPETPVMP